MSELFTKPTEEDLKSPKSRAKFSALVQLPKGIKGTLCSSCQYFDPDKSFCKHKDLNQAVSATCQCCSYYDRGDLKSVVGKDL